MRTNIVKERKILPCKANYISAKINSGKNQKTFIMCPKIGNKIGKQISLHAEHDLIGEGSP
jgi:hypothetical protein